MKRPLVLLFFLAYVFTATEAKQLLKLPVLFEHYAEHKQTNKTISFLDFMGMHYAGSDDNDDDQERDAQLPFKSHSDCTSINFIPFPFSSALVSIEALPLGLEQTPIPTAINFHSSYLSSIWQPPKSC